MAIDEGARYALHDRLRDVLGQEEASTLMAALPPLGGEGVATRADLRTGMAELRGEMAELGGTLRSEMAAQTRTLVFAMIGSNATLVALAFAAARFA